MGQESKDRIGAVMALLTELLMAGEETFRARLEYAERVVELSSGPAANTPAAAGLPAGHAADRGLDKRREIEARTTPNLEPSMPPPNPQWLWLTPAEKAILLVVSLTDWKSSGVLALEAGLPRDKSLEFLLQHMCERNILESAPGRGYRLKNAPL